MKSFFLFITSKDFPQEAHTYQFFNLKDARALFDKKIQELKTLFTKYREENISSRHTTIIEQGVRHYTSDKKKVPRKRIDIQLVRCDVHDPISMYVYKDKKEGSN